jgi:hypothetical protein
MVSSLSGLTLRNGYLQKRKKLKPWDGNWAGEKKPEPPHGYSVHRRMSKLPKLAEYNSEDSKDHVLTVVVPVTRATNSVQPTTKFYFFDIHIDKANEARVHGDPQMLHPPILFSPESAMHLHQRWIENPSG